MHYFIIILVTLLLPSKDFDKSSKNFMLSKVNTLRAEGCQCGTKWMNPVSPISWSQKLQKTAASHARDMYDNNFFGHYSKDGKNVGQRAEALGYNWKTIAENIAEGQRNFEEAFEDWVKSSTHCETMMDPRVMEMGVSRYGSYWVQHFGTEFKHLRDSQ